MVLFLYRMNMKSVSQNTLRSISVAYTKILSASFTFSLFSCLISSSSTQCNPWRMSLQTHWSLARHHAHCNSPLTRSHNCFFHHLQWNTLSTPRKMTWLPLRQMCSYFASANFYATLLQALLDVCSWSRPTDTLAWATTIPTEAGTALSWQATHEASCPAGGALTGSRAISSRAHASGRPAPEAEATGSKLGGESSRCPLLLWPPRDGSHGASPAAAAVQEHPAPFADRAGAGQARAGGGVLLWVLPSQRCAVPPAPGPAGRVPPRPAPPRFPPGPSPEQRPLVRAQRPPSAADGARWVRVGPFLRGGALLFPVASPNASFVCCFSGISLLTVVADRSEA